MVDVLFELCSIVLVPKLLKLGQAHLKAVVDAFVVHAYQCIQFLAEWSV